MAFKLVKSEDVKFFRAVDLKLPTESGGTTNARFSGEFVLLSDEELKEITSAEGYTDKALVRRVMVGWKDVVDEDGKNQIPFSDEALELLLAYPFQMVATPIAKAYVEAIQGKRYVAGN